MTRYARHAQGSSEKVKACAGLRLEKVKNRAGIKAGTVNYRVGVNEIIS
jgi:hypothetical protein